MSAAHSEDEGGPAEPGRPEPARLRRRPFGYRRVDVDRALDARDSDIAELRQDIAALWMAFAQHDRILRPASTGTPAPGSVAPPPEPVPEAGPPPLAEPSPEAPAATEDVESVDRQLSDLDEVLAAIEMATQTLERTHAEEIAHGSDVPPEANRPEDAGTGRPESA